MNITTNRASFLWMCCVVFVSGLFGYTLWFVPTPASTPSWMWIAFSVPVVLGSMAFIIMCIAGGLSLFSRLRFPYKPIFGFKTSQNISTACVALAFMFVEMYGLSAKTSVEAAQKQLAATSAKQSQMPSASPAQPTKPKTNPGSVPKDDGTPWGVQKQISDVTWTMKVENDAVMATPQEIFEALNNYRIQHGVNRLEWNDKLAGLAALRAHQQFVLGKLDEHAGFKEYTASADNMRQLGYWNISENASYGYKMTGVHIIEWAYSDPPHDRNQLNPQWNLVGIAVEGTVTDLIFGR